MFNQIAIQDFTGSKLSRVFFGLRQRAGIRGLSTYSGEFPHFIVSEGGWRLPGFSPDAMVVVMVDRLADVGELLSKLDRITPHLKQDHKILVVQNGEAFEPWQRRAWVGLHYAFMQINLREMDLNGLKLFSTELLGCHKCCWPHVGDKTYLGRFGVAKKDRVPALPWQQ